MRITRNAHKLLFAIAAVASAIYAQPPTPARPEFEVSSVKPVDPAGREHHAIEPFPGGLRMRSLNVVGLMMWAYQISEANQITGGPDWLRAKDFDIDAKSAEPTSTDQLRLMLQSLLAERFKLVLHREQKIAPSYSLVVNRNGDRSGLKIQEVQKEPRSGGTLGWTEGMVTYKMLNHISELAAILPTFLENRPVLDKTGLTGVYDLTLNIEIDADQMKRMPQQGMVFQGFGYTAGVFDAVKKLGLNLERTKGPVDFFVIDHLEQPSGN